MNFNNYKKNFFIFLLLLSNYIFTLPFYIKAELENKTNNLNLSVDYLKRFQENEYIIGPGDSLIISVSKNYPELTTSTLIDGEGSIYLPFLQRLYVSGLTTRELNELLQEAYKEFVNYPDVESQVIGYRPIKVTVEGEVDQPGLYTLKGSQLLPSLGDSPRNILDQQNFTNYDSLNILNENSQVKYPKSNNYFPTLFDLIKVAGGITRFSDLEDIKVIRKETISSGGGKKIASLNFIKSITGEDSSQNIRIYDGDVIRIKKLKNPNPDLLNSAIKTNLNPRYVKVFVTGRVNQPGLITVGKNSTLNDAIDVAGGAKILRGKVRYISYKNNGTIEKRNIAYRRYNPRGRSSNPYLKNGDLIIVGESLLSNTTQIINEVTSPFVGLYSAYSLIEAFSE